MLRLLRIIPLCPCERLSSCCLFFVSIDARRTVSVQLPRMCAFYHLFYFIFSWCRFFFSCGDKGCTETDGYDTKDEKEQKEPDSCHRNQSCLVRKWAFVTNK
jgi:hypothetical protein